MIKFKRHIKVDEQVFETWFGMDIKKKGGKPNVSIYYYTGHPDEEFTVNQLIKANFKSKDEAVRYGTKFVRNMYKDIIKRENENTQQKSTEEDKPSDLLD